MRRDSFVRSIRAFLADESGAVMAEYALVLTGLTISGMLAFQLIGASGNAAVSTNETNFTNTAVVAP